MSKLKITIITITYNSEKTVRETFESVKKQGYANLEYLVIDGGSEDSTLKIADEYKEIIAKLISEPDYGISDAMNKGIKLATGDLIGIIHSDDALVEGVLEELAVNWDGITDVYYGNAIISDESGKPKHILCSKEDLSNMIYSFDIVHPATFVTKKAYNEYGVFDKTLKCAMDYELLLRFYQNNAKFKYINENLAIYRVGGTNMRMRRRTIDEVRDVSIRHGGKKLKANFLRIEKILKDRVRSVLGNKIENRRVKKL